jgi:hypothetical protein
VWIRLSIHFQGKVVGWLFRSTDGSDRVTNGILSGWHFPFVRLFGRIVRASSRSWD